MINKPIKHTEGMGILALEYIIPQLNIAIRTERDRIDAEMGPKKKQYAKGFLEGLNESTRILRQVLANNQQDSLYYNKKNIN